MPSHATISDDTALEDAAEARLYEFCILYPYPFQQKEEQELMKGLEEIFAEAGGRLIMKDVWGRRGLAYPIGGSMEGNVVVCYFELEPSKIQEIDRSLRILKGVLRHMIVKPPKNYQPVSYAEKFVKWQEDRKLEGERRELEREEKLHKQVLEKAKRTTKVIKKPEPAVEAKPAITGEAISKGLEKIISDEDLKM